MGGIAGADGLKSLPILCNILFSFVGQRFQEPKSVIFLGNLLWRRWGKGGDEEGKKGHSPCPVADEILEVISEGL